MEHKYIVEKILNNNALVARDTNQEEVIILNKGIGWGSKVGDTIIGSENFDYYYSKSNTFSRQFETLLNEIAFDYIEFSQKIISEAKEALGKSYTHSLIIGLSDHISFAVQQFKQNQQRAVVSNEELKYLFPEEYQYAREIVKQINREFSVQLDEEEATALTFHFINSEINEGDNDNQIIAQTTHDVLDIISQKNNIDFDTNSLDYSRIVTHLKFFTKRILSNQQHSDVIHDFILNMNNEEGRLITECVEEISRYYQEYFNYQIDDNEKFYLLVHILRII